MSSSFVPFIPDNAPFTPEQRAYLNGLFAGLFSHRPTAGTATTPASKALTPLSILFASQSGNAENLAKRASKEAAKRGFAPTVHDVGQYATGQFVSERQVLLIASTFGDGDPPDTAQSFWNFLSNETAPKLSQMRFSVCALGDSSYPKFCAFGKNMDARLQVLGAECIHPRVDCDVDFEQPFITWLNGALQRFTQAEAAQEQDVASVSRLTPHPGPLPVRGEGEITTRHNSGHMLDKGAEPAHSRSSPFPAPLITNRKLNRDGSAKDTRHFEFALEGSELEYEVGDALGVFPQNCPELVDEIICALGCDPREAVPEKEGCEMAVREALLRHYEVTKIPQPFLQAVAQKTGDELLCKLAAPDVNGELTKFLWGREIIDLLLSYRAAKFTAAEFVALLKKLQPRLYSISSSPKAHPGQVHLTVSAVRYESFGRRRKGVCSTFLADRVSVEGKVPVFVHRNKNFRPPANGDTPMIMVGPGTGIAPFRAFLEERRATGAKGRNWLFFGDQHAASDFLYRAELEQMARNGLLTRFDTAFSRDQAEKVYVQHRMIEHASELFAWLEEGACFYVCGDASRMAKDVDQTLRQIIQNAIGSTEKAGEYVSALQAQKRYQRDVY